MTDPMEALLKRTSTRQIKLLRVIPSSRPKYVTSIYKDAKLTYREGEIWRLKRDKLVVTIYDALGGHATGLCITDLGKQVLEEYKRRNP